jgi:hypothetical protein
LKIENSNEVKDDEVSKFLKFSSNVDGTSKGRSNVGEEVRIGQEVLNLTIKQKMYFKVFALKCLRTNRQILNLKNCNFT